MADDITVQGGVRNGINSIREASETRRENENRIATGREVNEPKDNPAALFAAKPLNERAADLNSTLDSQEKAIRSLATADSSRRAISNLVNEARNIATEALAFRPQETTGTVDTGQTANAQATDIDGLNQGDSINITVGGEDVGSITVANQTVQELTDEINALPGVEAPLNGTEIQFSAESGKNFTITGAGTSDLNTQFTNGTNRSEFVNRFNEIRQQIDQLAQDSGFAGTNLAAGDDLTVALNEDGSSNIEINGSNLTTAGDLAISEASPTSFGSDFGIISAIGEINAATATLDSQNNSSATEAVTLEIRQEFNRNIHNTLNEGANSLTIADINEQAATQLAAQTRESLASQSISIGVSQLQSTLRLFEV